MYPTSFLSAPPNNLLLALGEMSPKMTMLLFLVPMEVVTPVMAAAHTTGLALAHIAVQRDLDLDIIVVVGLGIHSRVLGS